MENTDLSPNLNVYFDDLRGINPKAINNPVILDYKISIFLCHKL